MTGSSRQQFHREQKALERRRAARDKDARETQRQQMVAELRRDFGRRRRRHIAAAIIWVVAALIAVSHFFEHAGTVQIMSPLLEDLLLGWPMAALLAVGGAVIYGT